MLILQGYRGKIESSEVKSYQSRKKQCQEVAERNFKSVHHLGIFFANVSRFGFPRLLFRLYYTQFV